ncbi:MAG: hypothetical protein IKM20_02980 [Erysipelotrichales bacterium]|nr:hypothetical protein [Erysipelotrichales bacterium]
MNKLYIVFIASNYKTGNAIRFITGGKYNHVAIALDSSLHTLYSYARSNYFEPLNAGYQHETPSRYLMNGKDTQIKVCEYLVDDEHYSRIVKAINDYSKNQSFTTYNFADLLMYPFKVHIPINLTHTCVSFVSELLEIKQFMSLKQLEKKFKKGTIYEGSMKEYVGDYTQVEVNYFTRNTTQERYSVAFQKNMKLCQDVGAFVFALLLHIE